MENKQVGWLILGIASVMSIVIIIFNNALKDIVTANCTLIHGDASICPMFDTIKTQTGISLGIIGVIVIIGFVIMFQKPKEKIVIKTLREKKKKLDLSGLDKNEKAIVDLLQKEGNAVFQADLMEKLSLGKVKTTRLLDKLEAKQFIERKRRGMNNIVVLRD